jgi:hypothetical protein
VYNAIAIEELGKPAVAVTNQTYLFEGGSAASSQGMPGVRVVWDSIHSEEWVDESDPPDTLVGRIDPLIDDIVKALTRPLNTEEASPRMKEPEKPARIVFQGDLSEVNQFFYRRGWGDGLPLVPPTEEAVAEMMTGTDLPADHIVARIGPRLGKATVERIAINAVMAGALPTHLPVIIAGVRALSERASRFDNYQDSQGSWVPFWVINGPIRKDVHVNCGVGPLSPGDIANAAIGRALELIIINIGGIRKGIEDAGAFGSPGKFALVMGENEEESPWEPWHVERGFKRDESTLTLTFPNVFNWTFPWETGTEAVVASLAGAIRGFGMTWFVIPPGTARILAQAGYTKQKVKEYVVTHASPPARPMPARPADAKAPPRSPMAPDPDHFAVIVSGGPGGMYIPSGAWLQWQEWVVKKIDLPANWGKIVAKYKGLVPKYAKY